MGLRRNIILIGFSFTGKSRVARLVADRLGWKCVDLDEEIVKVAGKTILEIFSQDGEKVFRQWESRVLRQTCKGENQVIATGGGVILSEKNRRLMGKSGFVVCLEALPKTIYQRLLREAQESINPVVRPLLSGENPLAKITALKELRQNYYRFAHWTVHTDNLGLEEVAGEVIRRWQELWEKLPESPQKP
jgi:shikimate kinase